MEPRQSLCHFSLERRGGSHESQGSGSWTMGGIWQLGGPPSHSGPELDSSHPFGGACAPCSPQPHHSLCIPNALGTLIPRRPLTHACPQTPVGHSAGQHFRWGRWRETAPALQTCPRVCAEKLSFLPPSRSTQFQLVPLPSFKILTPFGKPFGSREWGVFVFQTVLWPVCRAAIHCPGSPCHQSPHRGESSWPGRAPSSALPAEAPDLLCPPREGQAGWSEPVSGSLFGLPAEATPALRPQGRSRLPSPRSWPGTDVLGRNICCHPSPLLPTPGLHG